MDILARLFRLDVSLVRLQQRVATLGCVAEGRIVRHNGTPLVAAGVQSINPNSLMVWLASREQSDFADVESFSEAILALVSVLRCSPCLMRENKPSQTALGALISISWPQLPA